MNTRLDRVRKGQNDQAVHVWGPDYERCALACEVAGAPVVRLESGGFFAEYGSDVKQLLDSSRFNVQHEALGWNVIEWRERGRVLFRSMVVDLEEEEYSADPSWGTQDLETSYESELRGVAAQTAGRLQTASADPVLVMCAWRVLDRERGLLTARYGLGAPEDTDVIEFVYEALGSSGEERDRYEQLRVASQAWW
jgi:hypothetical protein